VGYLSKRRARQFSRLKGDLCAVRDESEGDLPIGRRETKLEESLMSTRAFSSLVLPSLVLSTALGCSNQPTAPSRLDAAPPIESAAAVPSAATAHNNTASPSRFGDRIPGAVYVTSQGLYYDTFVVKDPLPMEGRFQQLSANGQTEFGPGQAGYLGGRWWVDVNGNSVQDEGDHFFLCPLLPPGRTTP